MRVHSPEGGRLHACRVVQNSTLRLREQVAVSRITGVPVVGQEEPVEEAVALEETGAVDGDEIRGEAGEAFLLEGRQLGGELFEDVDAGFLLVVCGGGGAELELQNEFADEAFFRVGGVGAEDGVFAALDGVAVGGDVRVVLQVDAAGVADG